MSSLKNAFKSFVQECYTLLIFELPPAAQDGLKMLKWFHQQDPIPIVVLSATPSKRQEILALELGADQYWGKPLDMDVVFPHIKALMRRHEEDRLNGTEQCRVLSFDSGLKIDFRTKSVYLDGERLNLHPKQFALLAALGKRIGQTVPKEQLYNEVWHNTYSVSCDETLKYHISKIRKALKAHGADDLIHTFWGVGYGLKPEKELHP